MTNTDPQLLFVMLALPALFGLTLVGEGVYRIYRSEPGWINLGMGVLFLIVVAFGYSYVVGRL